MNYIKRIHQNKFAKEPDPDIAICDKCGWEGHTIDCRIGEEGHWETSYYFVYLCPHCDEKINNFKMSPKKEEEWNKWYKEFGKDYYEE